MSSRREYVRGGLQPEAIDWTHIAALAENDMQAALDLWISVLEAADETPNTA